MGVAAEPTAPAAARPAAVRPGAVRQPGGAYLRAVEQAQADELRHLIEAAYRRHYPTLVQICRERTADPSRAEDLAQETLVRALRYGGALDPSRPVLPWLRTIAARVVIDDADRAASRRETVIDLTGTDEPVEDDFTDRLAAHAGLATAFASLSTLQQTALRLRFLEDWSGNDTARFLGITRAACDQLVSRAKRRLRLQLEQLGEGCRGLAPLGAGGFVTRIRIAVAQRRAGMTGWDVTMTSIGAVVENAAVALAVAIAGVTLPGVAAATGYVLGPDATSAATVTVVPTSQPVATSPARTTSAGVARDGAGAATDSTDGGRSVRSYSLRPTGETGITQAPPTAADAQLAKDERHTSVVVGFTVTAAGDETSVRHHATVPCEGPQATAGLTCRTVEATDEAILGAHGEGGTER